MPNTVIQLKKSATVSAKPSDLANGELAINFADGKLFYKNTSGFIAEFSSGVNSFGTVNANGTLVVSDTSGDILTLLAGPGINITGDAVNDRITFTATGNAVASFDAANVSNSIAIAAFAKANAALANTTGTFAGTLTVANDLIVTGNVGIGNTSPSPAKLFVDGRTRFAGDGAGSNWLEFLRAGSNNWRLDSSGVGTVMTIAGNLVTFPQNVLIQRDGLTVTPTTTTSSSLIVNHSATTNNSININLTPTWNGSGNTFTGYGINVTNIACNTVTSGFFHARANGNSAFRVDLAGNIYVREGFGDYQGYKITNAYDSTAFGGITNSFRQFTFSSAITFGMSNIDTQSRSDAALGWSRDTNSQGTMDIAFYKDAANTIGIRGGSLASGKGLRLYGNYTDASNYERINITANSSGHYIIGEEGGTGSARSLYLGANNAIAATIDVNGNIGIGNTSPQHKLHIKGSVSTQPLQRLEYWDNSTHNLYLGPYQGTGATYLRGNYDGNDVLSVEYLPNANTGARFYYGTRNASIADATYPAQLSFHPRGVETPTLMMNNVGNIGVGTRTPAYKLEVAGSFAAQTKSFIINHQSKPNHKLRHGSLEGPENGVYVRGKSTSNIIELPDYWTWLVDEDTITVNITPIGKNQNLFVEKVENNKVYIKNNAWFRSDVNYFYTVYGERNDVDKLIAEIPNP